MADVRLRSRDAKSPGDLVKRLNDIFESLDQRVGGVEEVPLLVAGIREKIAELDASAAGKLLVTNALAALESLRDDVETKVRQATEDGIRAADAAEAATDAVRQVETAISAGSPIFYDWASLQANTTATRSELWADAINPGRIGTYRRTTDGDPTSPWTKASDETIASLAARAIPAGGEPDEAVTIGPSGKPQLSRAKFRIEQSDAYVWKVPFANYRTAIGVRRSDGAFMVGGPLAFGATGLGLEVTQSKEYLLAIKYADGGVLFGLRRKTGALVGRFAAAAAAQISQPTWTSDRWNEVIPIRADGQSHQVGRSSLLPAALMAAAVSPLEAGRCFTLSEMTPRLLGENSSEQVNEVAPLAPMQTLRDHRESNTGLNGLTSSWGLLKTLIARGALPDAAFVTVSAAIGGQTIQTLSSGARLRNKQRSIIVAADHARAKGVPFGRISVVDWDQATASTNSSFASYKAALEAYVAERKAEIAAVGGRPEGQYTILIASASCYTSTTKSSDVPLVALALHLERPDVGVWGPEYILETAVGPYAPAGGADSVHRSAIGQLRCGVYKALHLIAWLNGAKRSPLYCTGGTLSADGLTVTLNYFNPRPGGLSMDTSFVTNPAIAGYDPADDTRPWGFMFAPGTGKAPHPTIKPVSFTISGDSLVLQLSASALGIANPMINIGNHYPGDPATGGWANGPDRGARVCLRNAAVGDDVTIAGFTISPHDYAMPQRIALQQI